MEAEKFITQYLEELERERAMKLEENSELIKNFTKHCSELGIDVTKIGFNYIPKIGVVAECKDILTLLDSRLSPDKEGLFDFRYLCSLYEHKPYIPGFFFSTDYMVMLSPLFRRSFYSDNNWAPSFVELFWANSKYYELDLEVGIRLDTDSVRINVNDTVCAERDKWYGPHFKDNIVKIKDGSAKLGPSSGVSDAMKNILFSNSYCLDIDWRTAGSVKSFQAQEFKEEDSTIAIDGADFHPSRYLHAEFDLDKNYFRHFDGAIQFFTNGDYLLRRKSHLRHNYKSSQHVKAKSQKLFKFNGRISVDLWCELSAHFFSQNPLFHEYISGEYPEHVQKALEKVHANGLS